MFKLQRHDNHTYYMTILNNFVLPPVGEPFFHLCHHLCCQLKGGATMPPHSTPRTFVKVKQQCGSSLSAADVFQLEFKIIRRVT